MENLAWLDLKEDELQHALRQILLSESAGPNLITRDMSVGVDFLADFWSKYYLEEYIRNGGSKIKFVTGRSGSGKTHLLDLLSYKAQKMGYITVNLSARDFMLDNFRTVYLEILRHVDLPSVFDTMAANILRTLGVDLTDKPSDLSYTDFLVNKRELDVIMRNDIRGALRSNFLNHPLMDSNFGMCCSLLVGNALGHPKLDDATLSVLMDWMHGESSQKLTTIKAVGLAPYRINKFNARHLLRSLAVLLNMAGYPGIFVTIDHLETVMNLSGLDEMKYTPKKRNDTYESIRQLVDDIDTLHHVFFIYAFNSELLHNEKLGLPSYGALWMRIQNEIVSERFNRFQDIANLDRLARQIYTPQALIEITSRLSCALPDLLACFPDVSPEAVWRRNGLAALIPKNLPDVWPRTITSEEAEALIAEQAYGPVGLVRQALRLSLGLAEKNPGPVDMLSEEGNESNV